MIISTNSWHYRFICSLRNSWDVERDICAYTRQIGWVTSNWLCIITLALALTYSFGDMFGWLVAGFKWGFVDAELYCFPAFFLIALIAMIGLAHLLSKLCSKTNTSFEFQAYKAFKNKYCIRLEFRGSKKEIG